MPELHKNLSAKAINVYYTSHLKPTLEKKWASPKKSRPLLTYEKHLVKYL